MNQKFKKNQMMKKVFTAFILLLAITPAFAQGGATAISNAASDIKDYWDPIKLILKAVGGLVGFIGSSSVQQMDEWRPGCEQRNSRLWRSNDFPHCRSRIRHRIFCLKWDFTFTRGLKNPLFSSD